MNNNRKEIRQRFLYSVYEISDKEYQQRIWVEGKGPEVSSFEEAICDFFDDGQEIILEYEKYGITEKQFKLLLQLQKMLEEFLDIVPEIVDEKTDILPNPKWLKIQKMAQKVLKAFKYQK